MDLVATSNVRIALCQESRDAERWEEFVFAHPEATFCHRWSWKRVVEKSFGWPTYYLMAEEDGRVCGVLPLVWQRSWLFGSFVSSMPFLNAGGVLAQTPVAERMLLEEAIRITQRVGARYLELRHRTDHRLDLPQKTSKVTVMLPLDTDSDTLWRALDTKIRTKVRKSMNFGMTIAFNGLSLLDEFYSVWSENMRDLGTPAYDSGFFREILLAFPEVTHLCVVRHRGKAIATSFLFGFRDRVEAVWSSSVRHSLSMKPNMFLYWNLFCFSGQHGYRNFDFGRSSEGSGTHAFKMQWGGYTVPLHWNYWLPRGGNVPELNPQNPRYRLAIHAWQKLPLAFARRLGPRIARCLP